MNYLITGGAGYIGSHTVLELLQSQGGQVVVLDNLHNSSVESLRRVERITGCIPLFVRGDTRDRALLDHLFSEHAIDAVVHFAGLKSVGESVKHPMAYYESNVSGSVTLCQAMAAAGVFRLMFSSSATVYGSPTTIPLTEASHLGELTNPYGRSKLMVEQILSDLAKSDPRWSIGLLRYFNPVGAHSSGLIGEDPQGIPNNLVPYINQVAVGRRTELMVHGNDYPTPDGTGVRDYIHVVDLAKGHLAALDFLARNRGEHVWNLGTGVGYSVLDIIRAFEQVSGKKIPYRIGPRRPGDIAECWSSPEKAKMELGWQAERGLKEMMADAWRWQENNPDGYEK